MVETMALMGTPWTTVFLSVVFSEHMCHGVHPFHQFLTEAWKWPSCSFVTMSARSDVGITIVFIKQQTILDYELT